MNAFKNLVDHSLISLNYFNKVNTVYVVINIKKNSSNIEQLKITRDISHRISSWFNFYQLRTGQTVPSPNTWDLESLARITNEFMDKLGMFEKIEDFPVIWEEAIESIIQVEEWEVEENKTVVVYE